MHDHTNDLQLIRTKIEKAATIAIVKEEILQCEIKDLQEYQAEIYSTRPRKKRNVLGSKLLTVKKAKEEIIVAEKLGQRQWKRPFTCSIQACKWVNTSEFSTSSSSKGFETENSNISTLIVCE